MTEPRVKKKLQHNPEPLKIVKTPRCTKCGNYAPRGECWRGCDYRWPDGTEA